MADYISKFQYNGTTWDMKDAEARQALALCVNNGYYDSNAKKIILRHDSTTIVHIDATDFIKDGMVSNVQVVNDYLVITFNTDAGHEPIRIPITDIFNPDNYYTKSATNGLLALKQDLIQDLAQIRQGANAGSTAYQKPQGGIPLSDINQNGIDNVPTNGSNNLVRSGGVQNELALGAVYDVSAHNNGATFASLQALLSNANIDTLIPTSVRKGGMSVKFVQSSDNKYVQYRYMGTATTAATFTNASNWQGVDDRPTANSNNLITSGGVKNALTIHLTYILYQGGTPTASGQYYIHNGELRYCTYFVTWSNYGYKVIPFNSDILYEYKGFYFKWDGTSLVMLETSVSEHLRTVAEVDGVKDANALDISDLVSSTYTVLNTDGTITDGTNVFQAVTLYHIPVTHSMRIRCRLKKTIVVGYKSIDDNSPIVLFNNTSSNPSAITTYDIRIPEEVTYIRIGSGVSLPIYLIEDDLYLQEIIDVDVTYPLGSGYYTLSAATAAVRNGNRTLDKKIVFSVDSNNREKWKFTGDTIADWNNLEMWVVDGDSSDENSHGVSVATGETASVIQSLSALKAPLDITKDWYVEFVADAQDIGSSTATFVEIGGTNGGPQADMYFRVYNFRNNLRLQFTTGGYIGDYSLTNIKSPFHFIAKQISNISYFYINGELVWTSNEFSAVLSPETGYEKRMAINPYRNIRLVRVGQIACTRTVDGETVSYEGADASTLVSNHYNGGDLFSYKCEDKVLLAEYLPENMHSSYILNTATNYRVMVGEGVSIITNDPYAKHLKGSGTPTDAPRYVGQKYTDTDTNDNYTAYGNSVVGDWRKDATLNDVNALKTQTKTVNGQSIWGSGDIEGGGSGSGGGNVISVLNYGAVGDGATDDTAAIMAATEASRAGGKALYFPNGTYLTRKSIVLTSGMKVTGEPNAVLQSASATLEGGGKCIFTTLTANAAAGATQITVNNAAGFVVGQEIVIWNSGSYTETMADITAISGNTITIDTSRFTANGTNGGIKNAVSSGGYVLTDFALIKTIQTKAAENIVVENLTLKAMSDMSEPHIYTSSPISQTRQETNVPQKNFRVYNVTVLDSANDGISIQGSGECEVIGCRVYNQKHKGIHWGTTLDMARIMNNYVYGCGSAQYEDASDYQGSGAMFFCSNNHRIIITGNHIENCYKGIFGFNYQGNGECDSNTIIANNTFKNCALYGVILRDGIHAILEANNFLGFGGTSIPIYVDNPGGMHLRNAVIANNTIGEWAAATLNGDNEYNPAVKITGADGVVLTGNVFSVKKTSNSTPTVDASRCNIVVIGSNNVIITNNITEGVIDISDSGNTGIVKDNNIEVV